jgi:hypothetical protein
MSTPAPTPPATSLEARLDRLEQAVLALLTSRVNIPEHDRLVHLRREIIAVRAAVELPY